MISVTKLLCDTITAGDWLRYPKDADSVHRRPIVVFNCTRRCNLNCIHCYSDSHNKEYDGELTTEEAKRFIDDLAEFKIPVLLFSGGEPLIRDDLFELAKYAVNRGLRVVLSTNGTLIDKKNASKIKDSNFSYVGISLDGIGSNNDKFRGSKGAFESALRGIRNCKEVGVKVGLRFTITKHNYRDLKDIFALVEKERIDRACFYHLVYSGRGSDMKNDDLSHLKMKDIIDYICDETMRFHKQKLPIEILTVDNHTDSVYLYKKIKDSNNGKADEVLRLLKLSGGNSSGIGIACVDNLGEVHADQFWTFYSFGNVRAKKFSEIWADTNDSVMAVLKGDRKKYIKGKCSLCKYFDICNGNFRVRAYKAFGDIWAEDPACYLSEEEIS